MLKDIKPLIPSIGIALFALLYIYAASLYPGGSQENIHTIGFNWVHNYWCNLLNVNALNGALNPARPYALTAMGLLCASLGYFFYQLPTFLKLPSRHQKTIQITGILALFVAALIATLLHDIAIVVSSLFGLVALFGVFIALFQNRLFAYFGTGLGCAFLLVLVNFLYYTEQYYWLPFLQKIAMAIVLLWIVWVNIGLLKRRK